MKQLRDHPVIASLLKTGHPKEYNPLPDCPYCGGAQTDWVFELDGELVCRDCFVDWVSDYASTNPRDVATALAVTPVYVG